MHPMDWVGTASGSLHRADRAVVEVAHNSVACCRVSAGSFGTSPGIVAFAGVERAIGRVLEG